MVLNKNSKDYLEKIGKIYVMLGLIRSPKNFEKIYDYIEMQYSNENRIQMIK